MRGLGIGLAALGVASVAGQTLAQTFAIPPTLTSGPSDEDIAAAWPGKAKQAGVRGEARIECRVSANGVMDNCQILQETPPGNGFGEAALSLTARFKAEAARVGGERTDGVVRFILQFPPSAAAIGPAAAGAFTLPEAVEKPSDDQIYAAWPGVARANHVEGLATLGCIVSLYGKLEDCRVTDERPAGLGFGEGALRLKDHFRYLPGTKDSMSVAVRMPIQVQFVCKARCTPFKLPADFKGKLVSVAWSQVPSKDEMAAAHPHALASQHAPGNALLFCRLQPDGAPGRCKVMSEQPQGSGVAAAALSLTPKFRTTVPKEFEGAGVQIPVTFSDEVGRPVLIHRPSSEDFAPIIAKAAADPKVIDAKLTLSCTVGSQGSLANCTASDESPSGLGLGDAVKALAPKFSVSQWGENGRPTQGSGIKVPLAFAVRDPPQSSDPVTLTVTQPQWLRRPSASDVERVYPERALSLERSGIAKLNCRVSREGLLVDCTVDSEAPAGLGFGQAALKLVPIFQLKPTTIEGEPVEGATINVPIIFRLE